ncbi:hypothetical protein A2U01_0083690, partial [Trifolium medium]|nr:hypothetical protein [Trifolium medium]
LGKLGEMVRWISVSSSIELVLTKSARTLPLISNRPNSRN